MSLEDLRPPVIVFVLGAPGAGKGTQCARIVESYGWTHLSAGDLLRKEVAEGSELGQQAEELMKSGQMVPTSLVLDLLIAAMQDSGSNRFLIDGFPRKLDQMQEFEEKIRPCDGVLVFTVSDDEAVRRLVKRGESSGRADDNEETIRKRMAVFKEESQPVIDALKDKGSAIIGEIDAEGKTPEEVYEEVQAFMNAISSQETIEQVEPTPDEAETAAMEEAEVVAEEAAPASEEPVVEEAAPAAEEPASEEAAPAAEEPAAEEAAPAAEEPAAEEAAPAAEEPAAEEAAPAAEEPAAEEAAPAAEEPAAEEAAPAAEEPAAEEAAPAAEEPAAEEAAPAAEEPAAEEAAPAAEEPAAEEEELVVPSVEGSLPEDSTIIFVLGGPGSGKGTQCDKIKARYSGVVHLSAGDLLRAEVESGSAVGTKCASLMKEGKLVPMPVTIALLKNAMIASGGSLFLIDGFPRAMDQGIEFESSIMECKAVIFFDCPEDEMQKRLIERGKTSGRADDNAETIMKRFKTFVTQSLPVKEYYLEKNKCHVISAVPPPTEVFAEVVKALDAILPASVVPAAEEPAPAVIKEAWGEEAPALPPSAPLVPVPPASDKPATPPSRRAPPPAPAPPPPPLPPPAPAPPAADKSLPVREYMDKTVVPILRDALRSLNDARPQDPLQFMADYLLAVRARQLNAQ